MTETEPTAGDVQHRAFNPYLPSWEYVPDAEPRVFDGRLYAFGSHDRFGSRTFCENDYVAWSAPLTDLADWTCHGVMFRKTDDPRNSDGSMQLYAPDVVRGVDGRFYLYYCLNHRLRVSVAVSDHPWGPYQFLGDVIHRDGTAYAQQAGDAVPFDPGVLVDDDGRVYLYTGFASPWATRWDPAVRAGLLREGAFVVELGPDMRTVISRPTKVAPMAGHSEGTGFEGHEFFEASSIRRVADRYVFVYSSILSHELCYATSDKPTGPFTFRGTLISNGDIGFDGRQAKDALAAVGNNHGGLVELDGQWWVFYHRHTNRTQMSRQGCADALEMTPDGLFRMSEMTSGGLGGTIEPVGRIEARCACVLQGPHGAKAISIHPSLSRIWDRDPYITQTRPDRDGNGDQYVAGISPGSLVGWRYFDLTRATELSLDISGDGEGRFDLTTQLDGPVVASILVRTRDGRRTASTSLPGGLGARSGLYLRYSGRGRLNLHGLEFAPTHLGALESR